MCLALSTVTLTCSCGEQTLVAIIKSKTISSYDKPPGGSHPCLPPKSGLGRWRSEVRGLSLGHVHLLRKQVSGDPEQSLPQPGGSSHLCVVGGWKGTCRLESMSCHETPAELGIQEVGPGSSRWQLGSTCQQRPWSRVSSGTFCSRGTACACAVHSSSQRSPDGPVTGGPCIGRGGPKLTGLSQEPTGLA